MSFIIITLAQLHLYSLIPMILHVVVFLRFENFIFLCMFVCMYDTLYICDQVSEDVVILEISGGFDLSHMTSENSLLVF